MRHPRPSWLSIAGIGALMLLGGGSVPASAAAFVSLYTHHDYGACPERPSPQPDVVFVRACAGLNGIPVIWTGEPDASSVDFGVVNDHESLGMGSFYEARDVIEWRGPQEHGALRPYAAIVRYATGPSISRMNASRLLVYRIAAGKPSCVMAVVTGADANVSAREIVDRSARDFVCGVSRRIIRR